MHGRLLRTVALLLTFAPGCAPKVYTLLPDEAQRVAEALRDQDEVEAIALDEDGAPVRIQVWASDTFEVEPEGRAPYEVEGLQAAKALEAGARVTLDRNRRGPTFLWAGLGLFVGGWALSAVPAAVFGDNRDLVPLYGPVLGLHQAIIDDTRCSGSSTCDTESHAGAAFASVVSLALQGVGLGLVFAGLGGLWSREVEALGPPPGTWEVEREDAPPVTLGIEPLMTGDGALGGVLTGRF